VIVLDFRFAGLLAAVFVAALLGTDLVKRLARQYGWVAAPRENRWHTVPTALLGGLGFYPVFLVGAFATIGSAFDWRSIRPSVEAPRQESIVLCALLLLGSSLLFVVGLRDDLRGVRPATKLVMEVIAVSPFILVGGSFSTTGIEWMDVLLTYFWFVGIINAVNMLDNMDGLASGIVVLAGVTLVALTFGGWSTGGNRHVGVGLSAVLVVAVLGFLIHNYPPASIFMGDAGSLALGYVLAGLSIPSPLNGYMGLGEGASVVRSVLVLLVPALTLAVPIFDTTLVTLTRKWRAQKASEGGKDHSSHRLVGLGMSERRAVWTLYALGALGGVVALFLQRFRDQSVPLTVFFVVLLSLTGVYLGRVKVQTVQSGNVPPAWTPLVAQILYKRHAAEVLLDTLLIAGCFYMAYLLRFDWVLSGSVRGAVMIALPLVVASCLIAFWFSGIYRGQWHLVTVADVPTHTVGVLAGVGLSLAGVTVVTRFGDWHSRGAFVIFGCLLLLSVMGSRLSFRLFDALLQRRWQLTSQGRGILVLIYGAGQGGKLLHGETATNSEMRGYRVLGFVDDDERYWGKMLCGLPVRGPREWSHVLNGVTPEIWISSRLIADGSARRLARQLKGEPPLRRMRLRMEVVETSDEVTHGRRP